VSDISPLAGLTGLDSLNCGSNGISDIAPLAGLSAVDNLDLHDNDIADIGPLAGMTKMATLDLSENRIEDISPLLGHTVVPSGGIIPRYSLYDNPLDTLSIETFIPELESRGIQVYFE
jgi:Leucine-rich repeat (LRR) protein